MAYTSKTKQTKEVKQLASNKPNHKGVTLQDNRTKTVQRKGNNTGLPDKLKSGIENLSGHSMDDVKVHYNSSKPAQLNAHAYAQGSDIHLGAGHEKHLPHEAWHVVQQKQGRVKPTKQLKSKVNINDDEKLEKEADIMGSKALQIGGGTSGAQTVMRYSMDSTPTVQRYSITKNPKGKLSEDRDILWTGNKDLYATNYQISRSNKLLKGAGPYGSMIELAKVGGATKFDDIVWRTFYKIKPTIDTESYRKRIQANANSFHKGINAQPEHSEMTLWADCRRASEVVTGASSAMGHQDRKVQVGKTEQSGYSGSIKRPSHVSNDSNTARLSFKVYTVAMKLFLDKFGYKVLRKSQMIKLFPDLDFSEEPVTKIETLKDESTENISIAERLYSALGEEAKDKFHHFTGTNEYANPEIGDSYATITEYGMPDFKPSGNDWSFHWGGVVMKDKGDNVTLENLSVSDERVRNASWYFSMYGTARKEQTFHAAQTGTGHHGSVATTITAITDGSTENRARVKHEEIESDPVLKELHTIYDEANEKRNEYEDNWVMNKLVSYIQAIIKQYHEEKLEPGFKETRVATILRMARGCYTDMDTAISEEGLSKVK